MQINLYKTKSEKNKLTKILENALILSGHLTESCDIINPVIKVKYNSDIYNKNYVFISDFHRYYYINDIIVDNEEIILSLHIDVLMTYKDDIKNSTGHIIRSVSNQNKYIIDEMISNTSNVTTYTRRIGNGFSPDDKYLITIGG